MPEARRTQKYRSGKRVYKQNTSRATRRASSKKVKKMTRAGYQWGQI